MMKRLLQGAFLYENLHKIYFIFALPIVISLVFLVPPFCGGSDEGSHFFRAVQIASGHLLGSKNPVAAHREEGNSTGGYVPASAQTFESLPAFSEVASSYDTKINTEAVAAAHPELLKWGGAQVFAKFPNTVFYGFLTYLPVVLGLLIAKFLGSSMLASFYFARFFNALIAITCVSFALKWISRGKCFAFAVLSMPMTLFLFSSLSQDAALIGYTALGVGLVQSLVDNPRSQKVFGLLLGTTVLFCAVAMGRPPYVLFLLLLPIICFGDKALFKKSVFLSLMAFAIVIFWIILVKPLVALIYISDPSVQVLSDPAAQIHYALGHMGHFLFVIYNNIRIYNFFLASMVGRLFLLLTKEFYILFLAGVVLCVIADNIYNVGQIRAKQKLMILLLFICGYLGIIVSQYLTFTVVGADLITGVNGRYFIPITLFLTFLLGQNRKRPVFLGIAMVLFMIIDVVMIYEILLRYYY